MRGRGRRWTGPNSSMVNRDRRDQAFARSVIAEATKRHNAAVDDRMNTLDDRPVEYGTLDGNTIKVRPVTDLRDCAGCDGYTSGGRYCSDICQKEAEAREGVQS